MVSPLPSTIQLIDLKQATSQLSLANQRCSLSRHARVDRNRAECYWKICKVTMVPRYQSLRRRTFWSPLLQLKIMHHSDTQLTGPGSSSLCASSSRRGAQGKLKKNTEQVFWIWALNDTTNNCHNTWCRGRSLRVNWRLTVYWIFVFRGDGLTAILERVNNDVSSKEGTSWPGEQKQMPEVRYTLRKSLVFSPCHWISVAVRFDQAHNFTSIHFLYPMFLVKVTRTSG